MLRGCAERNGEDHMSHVLSRRAFTASAAALLGGALTGLHAGPVLASPGLAADLMNSLKAFAGALSAANAKRVMLPFESAKRFDWHYFPRSRPGATLADLSGPERKALDDVLAGLLSPRGLKAIEGAIRLERVLGELTGNLSYRDPEDYAMVMFGDASSGQPVAFRFEGHHLSVSAVVIPGIGIAVTPVFIGANPAKVPTGHKHAGFRLYGEEEDKAFSLIQSLDGAAKEKAVIGASGLGDVVAGPGRETSLKSFEGAPLSALSEGQRAGVLGIAGMFISTMREPIAKGILGRVRQDGADGLHFAWAGGLNQGEPHYFRIHGPSVLIEYDNSRSGANHVHAVWIDPREVFGRDMLARHNRDAHKG